MNNFPDKYVAARAALATAMGWQGVTNVSGQLQGIPPQLQDPSHPNHKSIYRWHNVPDWTGHWGHCASLMIEYDCYPCVVEPWVGLNGSVANQAVLISEHNDKATAVRFAIVKAVTAKLEKQNG